MSIYRSSVNLRIFHIPKRDFWSKHGMFCLWILGLSHIQALGRTCILCLNVIPVDKNSILPPCINLLKDEKYLQCVQKVLPSFCRDDHRVPAMLCECCRKQLAFVDSNTRKPKLPKLNFVKTFMDSMPKFLRSRRSVMRLAWCVNHPKRLKNRKTT